MRCFLVSHFHWDREWYRPFEAFRSRLVDAIDVVLDTCAADPGYRFTLDGQAIVCDDYVAVRPDRRAELERAVRDGRVTIGPWYVQPDSFLPSGESHVRNVLIGRAIASSYGGVSRVAYVPDSFGHPAQFPQLFAGFGLGPFVYWRGNGDELDELGAVWRWRAPDGSEVTAWHLPEGYFAASHLDPDPEVAAARLVPLVEKLAAAGRDAVLLMNGFDHLPPDTHTGRVAAALAALVDAPVERATLDGAAAALTGSERPPWSGELAGARVANLLPGVWSARMPLKLRNRRCETLLTAWAEPWAAFGHVLGLPDERASLRAAWCSLLQNQAHDSVGGCSTDTVHERMTARYDDAEALAHHTVQRLLERLGGRNAVRDTPWSGEQEIVVFNPTPRARTDVVRVPLDAYPPWIAGVDRFDVHPLGLAGLGEQGYEVDGVPVLVVEDDDPGRVRFLGGQHVVDVEFVARDVPAFGGRRLALRPAAPVPVEVDHGREIAAGDVHAVVADDGTLTVQLGDRALRGLGALESIGDGGDSYDFAAAGDTDDSAVAVDTVERTRHPSGVQTLGVVRTVHRPDGGTVRTELLARVAPGVPRVDLTVTVDNAAPDHRLRLRFPTGAPVDEFLAATTFDTASRSTARPDDARWLHPAPATFPHQGWVAANGLVVGAPGLPEAEVTPDGSIAVTLLRSVGWLAKLEVASRPIPAGPEMRAPGAQVPGRLTAHVSLALDPAEVTAAEAGLRGVLGGPDPLLADGASLLALEPPALVLSACKPAEDGDGIIVRVLNPTDEARTAALALGFPVVAAEPVRLDETAAPDQEAALDAATVRFEVPPHALRSVRLRPA